MASLDRLIGVDGRKPVQKPKVVFHPFDASKDKPRNNVDGSYSTEITRTVRIGDGWVNVPSLWWNDSGEILDLGAVNDDMLANIATQYESQSGKAFPRFEDLDNAVTVAKERSSGGGATHGALASPSRVPTTMETTNPLEALIGLGRR